MIIHTREAEGETIEILKSETQNWLSGVMHCFSGSLQLAKQAIELGFYISFSGIITFKKADELRAVARQVPLDRLLIETDCPYLAPVPLSRQAQRARLRRGGGALPGGTARAES